MRIGVTGAGVMGTGAAQCFAAAGHDVLVADPDPAALACAPDRVRQGLRRHALAGRPVTSPADVLGRVRWTDRIGELTDVGFVVECVPERIGVKEEVFRELDQICPPGTVLASCTSAIPIAKLAALTRRPDAVIGTHFMNPVLLIGSRTDRTGIPER